MPSAGEQARERGNVIYKSINFNTMAPSLVSGRLLDAAKHYASARQLAQLPDEACKACKNLATVYSKLTLLQLSKDNVEANMYHYEMTLTTAKDALDQGLLAHMSAEWIAHLKSFQMETVVRFMGVFLVDSVPRIQDRGRLCTRLLHRGAFTDETLAYFYSAEAQLLFNHAVKLREQGDFLKAKSFLDDTYTPLTLCQEQNAKTEIINEHELYEFAHDVQMEKNACESLLMLDKATRLVKEAADMLRFGLHTTSCLETECMIRAQMASLYKKHLGMTDKARGHAKFVVKEVAESFAPRNVTNTDWYKLAAAILKEIQDEIRLKEELNWNVKRAPFVLELKTELAALKSVEDDIESLLLHVYEKHPPKNPVHTLNKELLKDSIHFKKLLQKAVIHYHPDKADTDSHGFKWKVLCEEITKSLSNRYNMTKGLVD